MSTPQPEAVGIDQRVALRAAEWFFLLQSSEATAADHRRCAAWRAADPINEIAWQRAERINRKFQMLPSALAMPTLGRRGRSERRMAIKALAVALSGVPVGWLGLQAASTSGWLADHRTRTGERREVLLPDGTRMVLNTASAADVVYDGTQRLLRLRAGEILVQTASDVVAAGHPAFRPFVVETPAGTVRALGTRFIVRLLDDARSLVTVLESAVQIQPVGDGGRTVVLRAGQQASFSGIAVDTPGLAGPHSDDWSRGILRAANQRLEDFLAELGRYRPGVLRCDPAVADLRVSGVFQLRDTGPILDSLPQALPVTVRYRTRYWVAVSAEPR
jgi:transmembrane sensor